MPGSGAGGQVPDDLSWEKFQERFARISRRMVDKMQTNLTFMVNTTKKSLEQIIKEISGGGGRER